MKKYPILLYYHKQKNISKSMQYRHEPMMVSLFLLLLMLQSILQLTASSSSSQEAPRIAKPGCEDRCGEVRIPYPFGIGSNCYHDEFYEIICNNATFHPPKPFLHHLHLEVMDIIWLGKYSREESLSGVKALQQILIVRNSLQSICTSHGGGVAKAPVAPNIDLRGSPYRFSSSDNVFVVEGCGANVVLKNSSGEILTGCSSICINASIEKNVGSCCGVGCCQAALPSLAPAGLDFYKIDFHTEAVSNNQTCNMAAGLVDLSSTTKYSGTSSNLETFTTVLEWNVADTAAKALHSDNLYSYNSSDGGQRCQCNWDKFYEGNPHLSDGCQLAKGCQKCKHGCAYNQTNHNGTGYYFCKQHHHHLVIRASILGFGISIGSVILFLVSYWLYLLVKRIQEVKQKSKCFERNGGSLLQQQISSNDGIVEKTRIFGFHELENATNSFSEDRILGQGGQGTVYKGMLVDGRIVAIKKSKKVDKSQLEQFINEMVILSRINHRNVVKLLGCCLETEVPLLVYEFIINGTLYEHIHYPSEGFHLTWQMRLRIAAESANALAYLHSSSAAPIYHRDIKSSNILLDEKYRAKVSDFGTSKAITIEQTHVTTCVQGTYGYVDPEYFQSNQFTDKSDVYSFGVVLVELITGKKPVYRAKSGGWITLATVFLFQMEKFCLFNIVDNRISEEAKEEDFIAVANLARKCLNMKGKQRPTMREVAVLLDGIK